MELGRSVGRLPQKVKWETLKLGMSSGERKTWMDQRCVLEIDLTALGIGVEIRARGVRDDTVTDACTGHSRITEEVHPTQMEVEHREVQENVA